jgi:hypothetical protein
MFAMAAFRTGSPAKACGGLRLLSEIYQKLRFFIVPVCVVENRRILRPLPELALVHLQIASFRTSQIDRQI